MDAITRDREGDPRLARWSGDPKKLLRVGGQSPSLNLLGESISTADIEGEQERLSPLRGEIDPLKELPSWSLKFESALNTLNETTASFDKDKVRDDESHCAALIISGLTNAGSRDSLISAGRIWIANRNATVNKALTVVKGGKAFLDALDIGSISTVDKLANEELIDKQEAFYREPTLTFKGQCLMALVKFCMVFGWLACAVGVAAALREFIGVDLIPSALSGFAVSTALTVATKIIIPQGKPSRLLCGLVFMIAVMGALSITVGAGLLKPRGEFELGETSEVPVDALLLGGVCLLDLALMLGLTCITRSVLYAASAFAQLKPATRMALVLPTMAHTYGSSVSEARVEVDQCLINFESTCHQVGLRLLENSLQSFFDHKKKG
jgi:hypothetical protein